MNKIKISWPSYKDNPTEKTKNDLVWCSKKYGHIDCITHHDKHIIIKYADERDAEDAMYMMDEKVFDDVRIKVEKYVKKVEDIYGTLKVVLEKLEKLEIKMDTMQKQYKSLYELLSGGTEK